MSHNQNNSVFSGVYAASLTPVKDDLSCDYEAFTAHCKDLIRRGCKGVLLFGTTGEGTSFSAEEKEDGLKALIERGVNPEKIILTTGCCALPEAIWLASKAVEQKCSGILVLPPFFYKNVSEEGVIGFYRQLIQSVDRPELKMFLYHIPQFSGVPITLNIIQALRKEFPEIVIGMKESEGNLGFTREVIKQFPGFKVFVGKDLQLSEAVQAGASGGMSGMANVCPELTCSLYAYGKDSHQPNYNETFKSLDSALKRYSSFPAIKNLVLRQKGFAWHTMRPPLLPLTEKQSVELVAELSSIQWNSLPNPSVVP